MKKVSFFWMIWIGVYCTSSFAACEDEKNRADRNRQLCDCWGKASVTTATGGIILGSILFGPLGGLCGASGLIPGAAAKRFCDLAEEKEKILRECLKNEAVLEERAQEAFKQQVIESKAQSAGLFLGQLFVKKKAECEILVAREIDNFVNSLIDSNRDLTDPAIMTEIEEELRRIQSRYY